MKLWLSKESRGKPALNIFLKGVFSTKLTKMPCGENSKVLPKRKALRYNCRPNKKHQKILQSFNFVCCESHTQEQLKCLAVSLRKHKGREQWGKVKALIYISNNRNISTGKKKRTSSSSVLASMSWALTDNCYVWKCMTSKGSAHTKLQHCDQTELHGSWWEFNELLSILDLSDGPTGQLGEKGLFHFNFNHFCVE